MMHAGNKGISPTKDFDKISEKMLDDLEYEIE